MKNMNIEIDKRKLLDSVLKSLKENELGYGSTSANSIMIFLKPIHFQEWKTMRLKV